MMDSPPRPQQLPPNNSRADQPWNEGWLVTFRGGGNYVYGISMDGGVFIIGKDGNALSSPRFVDPQTEAGRKAHNAILQEYYSIPHPGAPGAGNVGGNYAAGDPYTNNIPRFVQDPQTRAPLAMAQANAAQAEALRGQRGTSRTSHFDNGQNQAQMPQADRVTGYYRDPGIQGVFAQIYGEQDAEEKARL
jgi:hypothetical protein